MALLNVNPTRVELRSLSQRLQIAVRGHDLLKEKQDSLIRKFMSLTEQAIIQRRTVELRMKDIFESYQKASIVTDESILQQSLNVKDEKMDVNVKRRFIFGVKVPHIELNELITDYEIRSYFFVPRELDVIHELQNKIRVEIIRLAEIEKHCFLMGKEIIAVRRRVNSLEFRTIPDLEDTIAYIKMKIDDTERGQIAKLIKLK